ncbi:MAG: peptidylprolyl isomerase [Alphaproteobacteria bacterium]
MKFALPALLLLLAFPALAAEPAAPAAAAAADEEKIAVVVNDSAITTSDIRARYLLALISSGMADSPENRNRIMPQVMRNLIDEQIQLQETRRQQISVSQQDIDQALSNIAASNNVPGGDMRAFLAARGVPPETIENQARANIGWIKLVQRQLRPRVEVGDDEVEEALGRIRANAGKQEYFVNEIFLPVDDPEQESAVRDFADKLFAQIRQSGAFGAIARQFSQGPGAMQGGEIGWVRQGMLAPEIDRALGEGKKGDLLGPIKSAKGYHIIAVRDERRIEGGGDPAAKVKIAQLTLPVTATRDRAAALAEAEKMRDTIHGCGELAKRFDGSNGWRYQELEDKPVADMPPWLAEIARTQKVGEAGQPVPTGTAAGLFVVCERTEQGDTGRSTIVNSIGTERLENLARRLLRDLKRNAYIDIRI